MRAAVLGATGFVGRALVPALAKRDKVTPGALEGVDVAYHLVHSLGARNFSELDRRVAENVLTEAERAGVTQIVYLGALGDDAPDLSPHLRSRTETGAVLSTTTVPLTTLRAAVVVGRGSAAFETIVALVDRLPMMVAPRWVSTPTQRIALTDMVRYLTGVAGRTEAPGESFDVGGPDVITYGEMIQRIARLRGKRPLIVKCRCSARGCRHTGCTRHAGGSERRTPARRGAAQPDDRAPRPHSKPAPVPFTSFANAARDALDEARDEAD